MDSTKNKIEKIRYVFQNLIPANKIFGIVIDKIDEGKVELHVPFKEEFIGDFRQGLWHGGILASIADTAGGLAGATTLTSEKDKINTIDMRIDYLNPAYKKPIYVSVKLIKVGKRVIKTDVTLFQEDKDKPVAVARCAYSVLRNN